MRTPVTYRVREQQVNLPKIEPWQKVAIISILTALLASLGVVLTQASRIDKLKSELTILNVDLSQAEERLAQTENDLLALETAHEILSGERDSLKRRNKILTEGSEALEKESALLKERIRNLMRR